jgi:2Fe-2S ferredoxin
MAKVTFITPDGNKVVVENAVGTLMEIAVVNGVDGIDGSCGGVCSCGTCHVKVPRDWMAKVGPANETEQDLLNLENTRTEYSRLGCQIEMTEALDGLVVEVVKH